MGGKSKFDSVEQKFLSGVQKGDTPDECWSYPRVPKPNGYCVVSYRGQNFYTHRVSYAVANGPIPAGLVIDHLCRNRACSNPAHLEAVTQLENVRRGQGHGSETHCPQGHPYSAENTRVYDGKRRCYICDTNRKRRRMRR